MAKGRIHLATGGLPAGHRRERILIGGGKHLSLLRKASAPHTEWAAASHFFVPTLSGVTPFASNPALAMAISMFFLASCIES